MTDLAGSASNSPVPVGQLADRYGIELAPSLADWFESDQWQQTGRQEYHAAVTPGELLADAPEPIWPGLMNASLLPLISNRSGDWICGVVDENSQISRLVQWYHGGGDWILWGNGLPEAIAFDRLQSRLPGPRRRHAIPAEDPGAPPITVAPSQADRLATADPENAASKNTASKNTDLENTDPWIEWATQYLPPSVAEVLRSESTLDPGQLAGCLIDAHVAETAVRCELIQDALQLSVFSALPRSVVEKFSSDSDQISRWSLQHDSIPPDVRQAITEAFNCAGNTAADAPFEQDWDAAETQAVAVTQLTPDIAWGWDISGLAALRRGDRSVARDRFLRGIECSVFSDQSIRLQTHGTVRIAAKFSAAMLAESFPETVAESPYLQALCEPNLMRRSDRVSKHWWQLAETAFDEGDFAEAHRCYVAAGWDVGMRPITAFADLLDRIAESADRSKQTGRSALARVHRGCLQDRYGT
ncbi:hypothetical protein [Rubripirellula lacrimiformis]|uniref:hypothetical protein n=1 Tax=Rubripirellula lacrimiformis TaxID=1930273 RepID=UPI00119DD45E|nr:hypothetical protein [Rubripirellula lacrimiformis]